MSRSISWRAPAPQSGPPGDRHGRRADHRQYYEFRPPPGVGTTAERQVLSLLRELLATIWVDATPAADSWPVDVSQQAAELRARVSSSRPRPLRPGTGPDTVVLDPADDADFSLATTVAPFSSAVEAMSRSGQLLLGRGRKSENLGLLLTEPEWVTLTETLKDDAHWLIRATRPSRPDLELEARSRGWRLGAWLIAAFVAGPFVLGLGVRNLLEHSSAGQIIPALFAAAYGSTLTLGGLRVVGHALRRRAR